MTEAYRSKLLNWFCSVALLLTASALTPLFYWFIDLPKWMEISLSVDLATIVGQFSDSLLLYPLLFPIFLIWHLFDFIQRGLPERLWSTRLTSYGSFLSAMTLAIILFLLMDLGLFQYNSCDQLEGALFHQCYVRPSLWLMFPWLAALGLAIVLCIAKAGFSIRSLFKKAV